MSRFFQDHPAGGFRLDSPVKVSAASEMPRCAPPHANGAGQEPCQGGGAETKAPERGYLRALFFDGQSMSQGGQSCQCRRSPLSCRSWACQARVRFGELMQLFKHCQAHERIAGRLNRIDPTLGCLAQLVNEASATKLKLRKFAFD